MEEEKKGFDQVPNSHVDFEHLNPQDQEEWERLFA